MKAFQLPEPVAEKLAEAYYCKRTNADRIRSMTDEELAEWIRDQIIDRNIGIPSETWLDWLKQEAAQ